MTLDLRLHDSDLIRSVAVGAPTPTEVLRRAGVPSNGEHVEGFRSLYPDLAAAMGATKRRAPGTAPVPEPRQPHQRPMTRAVPRTSEPAPSYGLWTEPEIVAEIRKVAAASNSLGEIISHFELSKRGGMNYRDLQATAAAHDIALPKQTVDADTSRSAFDDEDRFRAAHAASVAAGGRRDVFCAGLNRSSEGKMHTRIEGQCRLLGLDIPWAAQSDQKDRFAAAKAQLAELSDEQIRAGLAGRSIAAGLRELGVPDVKSTRTWAKEQKARLCL